MKIVKNVEVVKKSSLVFKNQASLHDLHVLHFLHVERRS